jgi:hypothetical protein
LRARTIVVPKRREVTCRWERLQNEEFQDFQSSPNIVSVIKSRRMRWAGRAVSVRLGEIRNSHNVLVRIPEEEIITSVKNLGEYVRMILKCILKKQDARVWTGFSAQGSAQ